MRIARETLTFIGVTTAQSAATRLFPRWAGELGRDGVTLAGCDLPIHAEPQRYREVVQSIKGLDEPQEADQRGRDEA